MANPVNRELPTLFLDAVQYYAHTGDVGCLLAPQRALLGVHNVNGDTALHTAIIGGQVHAALQFVRVMLADDLDMVNAEGQTALHLSAITGMSEVASALVKRGASITVRDTQGNTGLHLAKTVDVVRAILRAAPADDAKRVLDTRNDAGLTPLHVVAMQGRLDMALEMVARHGANVNAQDSATGRTPLHYAVRSGSRPLCELLLEFEADPNAACSAGNTPLHSAVQYDQFGITKLLVDFGADCVATNAYFQTPLDLAMHYGSTDASRAMMAFPSIRVPGRNLGAVAAAAFPAASMAKKRAAAAPAAAPTDAAPAAPAAPATLAPAPAPAPAPKPATAQAPKQDVPKVTAGKSLAAPLPTARSSSEGEWQILDQDDVSNEGETEWHLHRNKKITTGVDKLDKLAKFLNQKRRTNKDKHAEAPAAPKPAHRSMAAVVPQASPAPASAVASQSPTAMARPAPRSTVSAPPSAFGSAGPTDAKAEKAQLAAQFGSPTDVTVSTPPSLSAKEEKKLLAQKFQPKVELQVSEKRSTDTSSPALTKAAEAAASAAASRVRPSPAKFDELSTLD